MSKTLLVTNAEVDINQAIVRHYLGRGLRVIAQCENPATLPLLTELAEEAEAVDRLTVLDLPVGGELVDAALYHADRLDVCVVGVPSADENQVWSEEPMRLMTGVADRMRQIFGLCRQAGGQMMKHKQGSFIFPLVYDSLCHAGVPTSPILDQAKVVFAKSLAKEMAPFKVAVNLMTFGLHDRGFERAERREVLDRMAIFNLKPRVRTLSEMIPALDMLVFPPVDFISGQNIYLEPGMQFDI